MVSNTYQRTTMIALAATVVVALGGWFGLISPQLDARSDIQAERASVDDSIQEMNSRLPVLMTQLEDITPQVEVLRDLSAKVPPAIDQPTLYADISQIAADAGISSIDNIAVSVPQMVTGQEGSEGDVENEGPTVLAAYTLTIQLRGNYGQVAKFLQGLGDAPRMSEVTYTSVAGEGSEATATVRATLFLQQVDAEGLASQIEALTGQS